MGESKEDLLGEDLGLNLELSGNIVQDRRASCRERV